MKRFLDCDEGIRLVTDIEIDVVGLQPAQARLTRLDQMFARQADVVRPLAEPVVDLRDEDEVVAAARQRLAEDLFRGAE